MKLGKREAAFIASRLDEGDDLLAFAYAAAVCPACGRLPKRHCYPEPKAHEIEYIPARASQEKSR